MTKLKLILLSLLLFAVIGANGYARSPDHAFGSDRYHSSYSQTSTSYQLIDDHHRYRNRYHRYYRHDDDVNHWRRNHYRWYYFDYDPYYYRGYYY